MPTQLQNTWLPPETRHWANHKTPCPIDYGHGEYGFFGEVNVREADIIRGTEIQRNIGRVSLNIERIIREYALWQQKPTSTKLQKFTDGKECINIDELLWYLRYENLETIAALLHEDGKHPIKLQTHVGKKNEASAGGIPDSSIPNKLLRDIKQALDEAFGKKV